MNIKNVAIIILFFSNYAYSGPPTIEEYQDNSDVEAHNIYIYGLARLLRFGGSRERLVGSSHTHIRVCVYEREHIL